MLNKHDYRLKSYLKLEKKMQEVREKLWAIPWVPVGEPFKDGWYIFYDLRKDISFRKDAQIIRDAIGIGYYRSFTRNVVHVKAVRAGKKSVKGKKGKIISLCPGKCRLTPKEYEALSPTIKRYFELDELSERYTKWGIKEYRINMPAYWLTLRTKGRVVTHIQKKGGELESEYQFLSDQYYNFFDMRTGYTIGYPKHKARRQTRDAIQKFKNGDSDDICVERFRMDYTDW